MIKTLPSALVSAGLLLSGCASIVSHSRWPVAITSNPAGATVTVLNRAGNEVYSGITPAAVSLSSGAGFFRREIYTVKFTKAGYDTKSVTLESDVNGWYFGNLVFGGLIGFLIVDPATGAMYRISQRDLSATLTQTTGSALPADEGGHSLRVLTIDQVPANLRPMMVPMQ